MKPIEMKASMFIAKIIPLIDAFKVNKDIHSITASEVFKIPLEEITSEIRSKAKER